MTHNILQASHFHSADGPPHESNRLGNHAATTFGCTRYGTRLASRRKAVTGGVPASGPNGLSREYRDKIQHDRHDLREQSRRDTVAARALMNASSGEYLGSERGRASAAV